MLALVVDIGVIPMRGLIPLKPTDLVFVLGRRAYALCRTGDAFDAAEIVVEDGLYFRREASAELPQGTINGVVCQSEYMEARYLAGYPLH